MIGIDTEIDVEMTDIVVTIEEETMTGDNIVDTMRMMKNIETAIGIAREMVDEPTGLLHAIQLIIAVDRLTLRP